MPRSEPNFPAPQLAQAEDAVAPCALEALPSEHRVQLVAPVMAAKEPAAQRAQDPDAAWPETVEYIPAGQLVQAAEAEEDENVPGGHASQPVLPSAAWKLPRPHPWHVAEDDASTALL